MGVLSTARSKQLLILAGGAAILIGAVLVWSAARRLPVAETRQFLTAPIEVGDALPKAPADLPPTAEVEERFTAAETAFHQARYEDAATQFEWVAAHDPAGPHGGPAQWNLVRSRLRSGDGNGAMRALDGLLRQQGHYLGEQSPKLLAGLEAMERGDLVDAQTKFEEMIREQPDSEFVPLSHALLARIYWTHGEPMDMVKEFARMFASVKDEVPAYGTLAKQLDRYANGDKTVAQTFTQLAKDGDPGFRDIYQYLAARSLLEQDQFEATRAALEELRSRYPNGDFTHIVDLEEAWNLLRHERPADALAIFQRLEQTPPPAGVDAFDQFFDLRTELPTGVARCQLALGHYAEAATAFERAIGDNPNSIYVVENELGLARSYEGLGQLDRAATVLRKVIAEHPDEPKLWAIRQQLERVETASSAPVHQ